VNIRLIRSYLLDLYKLGAGEKMIKAPTTELANFLGVSQQSVSRILNKLHTQDYIYKELRNRVLWIRITEKGLMEIEDYIKYVNDVYVNPGRFVFEGYVSTGLGEGAYYMSRKQYVTQFESILGFKPYPGTLNVRLKNPFYIYQNRLLRRLNGYKIKGFRTKERVFGDVKAFKAIINDRIDGAVIYAERSIYGFDMLEVIAPEYLRGFFKLKDDDKIKVVIYLNME